MILNGFKHYFPFYNNLIFFIMITLHPTISKLLIYHIRRRIWILIILLHFSYVKFTMFDSYQQIKTTGVE